MASNTKSSGFSHEKIETNNLLMIVLIRLNTFDFMTIDRNAGRPN